jgi:SAM-dependent methyltransferase
MNESAEHAGQADSWKSGESYQHYIGRWSRLVADEFVGWLGAPPQQRWLDVGCGTGVLSRTILDLASPASVHGLDPSENHITFARSTIRGERVSFRIGAAESLQLPDDSFDAVVSGLVLNFVPDVPRGIAEMKRVTRHHGLVGAYVWDYAIKMELIRYFWDAAVALDEAAVAVDEGRRFPLCNPGPLKSLFTGAGLEGVEIRPIDVATRFEDFNDYWSPFLGGQGPAPGYAMSLSEEHRARLADRIRAALPIADDGSINLIARAWAIRGRKS